jgi:hypothetical protein
VFAHLSIKKVQSPETIQEAALSSVGRGILGIGWYDSIAQAKPPK